MRWLLAVALVVVLGLSTTMSAAAAQRAHVVRLTAAEEVPLCALAGPEAGGVAIFRVLDEAAGIVEYRIVANNLPGSVTAAHIHVAPPGEAGPVVQPLPLIPGAENGVIGQGTVTNPTLLAAIQANPRNYYVNVHSNVCTPGVIRGQFG